MVNNFLIALVLTIIIEIIVLFLVSIFFDLDSKKFSNKNIIFAGIVASALTLPYLHFVLVEFLPWWNTYITVWEISVTVMEAIFYMFFFDIKIKLAFILSFLANFVSFSVWVILFFS